MSESAGAVPAAATWGLLAAWAVHDLEELVAIPGWSRRARPRLRRELPWVPERVWDRLDVSPAHNAAAIGLMGVVVAAAAADGARTGGRSGFYQTVLLGFGAHAVVHVAQSAATRGYTPGAVTAPLVVVPFSLWAWSRLRAAGVPAARGGGPAAMAALPAALGAVHGLAALLTRGRRGKE
ncbi:HXXEE domain-containing protein [Nocardiopsis changdeensis]|uniref:HXXEE domain-containing protein n=1 Tax=Nocardiopsis changdeensis TaxID=2831969 RepID=A0ABX8BMD2_9ACTN|nr:HXXEE domain-containing protein [Nocardiopsis changdeensis]QUX22728.1 HXXEE domain-containing protein [Nocardiopsis changdeensis]